jgi:hypothetical protein
MKGVLIETVAYWRRYSPWMLGLAWLGWRAGSPAVITARVRYCKYSPYVNYHSQYCVAENPEKRSQSKDPGQAKLATRLGGLNRLFYRKRSCNNL